MASRKKSSRVCRRADTGEYVTEAYAKRHPRTTVSEPRHRGGKKKK